MGDKSVETRGSKVDFGASWSHLPPSLKIKLIFLFLRLHRPQRLHNIEFGAGGIRELTLDANKIKQTLSIEKRHFLRVSQLLLSLIVASAKSIAVCKFADIFVKQRFSNFHSRLVSRISFGMA